MFDVNTEIYRQVYGDQPKIVYRGRQTIERPLSGTSEGVRWRKTIPKMPLVSTSASLGFAQLVTARQRKSGPAQAIALVVLPENVASLGMLDPDPAHRHGKEMLLHGYRPILSHLRKIQKGDGTGTLLRQLADELSSQQDTAANGEAFLGGLPAGSLAARRSWLDTNLPRSGADDKSNGYWLRPT